MKKLNLKLGILISMTLVLVVLSFRIIRLEEITIGNILPGSVYNFIFFLICWILHNLLLHNQKELYNGQGRLYATMSIITIGLFMFVFDWLFDDFTHRRVTLAPVAASNIFVHMASRSLFISSFYYLIVHHLHVISEKQKHLLEIAKLKQAELEANISSLKEQLSPHFLFNTLNTLSSLTEEKSVKNYVAELANVYRYVLSYKKMDKASLHQELQFIDSYLYIIKTRLGEAVDIRIDVPENVKSSLIPPLSLQLLIENALKHNIAAASKQLKINISCENDEYLTVSNDIQPKVSVQPSTGIGLNNIVQRYQLLFDKQIVIEKSETIFTVKLPTIYA